MAHADVGALGGMVPSITTSAYAATAYDGVGNMMGTAQGGTTNPHAEFSHNATLRRIAVDNILTSSSPSPLVKDTTMAFAKRRLVKVIIVDTDDNVPLEKCVLYSGAEKLTDATDQELFFEIDIKNILDEHNKYRVTLKDKSVKERVENLEPVKIRDLRMVVVNVATF